ncbi:MAG: VIT domain-containing protein [Chitinophagales bacterium]
MKKVLFSIVFCYTCSILFAQQTIATLTASDAEKEIYLKDWDIDIKIAGNIAVTTQKLVFHNPNDRVLEGEFNFPLNYGQTVSRFAMDFNGVLREGSIVDKEKGRKTFERIVRQNVDPGLLEMTKGNNFRARVYPIPAKGTKTIVVAYEQELPILSGSASYFLPLDLKDSIPFFHLKVNVIKNEIQPKWIENSITNLTFDKIEESFIAEKKIENFKATSNLSFDIPIENTAVNFVQTTKSESYFYAYQNYTATLYARKPAKTLVILYDVSSSRQNADRVKEIIFLTDYLQHLKNVTVELIPFSNAVHTTEKYIIQNGNSSALIKQLTKQTFDGGTQYGNIHLSDYNYADEVLLFTDGISNFGKQKFTEENFKKPLFVINSSSVSNHDYLHNLAKRNNGTYIQLLNCTMQDATNKITITYPKIINIECIDGNVKEIYPKTPVNIYNGISITGILKSASAKLKVSINTGDSIEQKIITITNDKKNTEFVQRLWANKKIADLMSDPEKNESLIKETGLKYSIVTPSTSLIVLDNIDDYIRYEIAPPAEMQKEYLERLAEKKEEDKETREEDKEELKDQIDVAYEDMQDRIDWWNTSFPKKEKKVKPKKPVTTTTSNTSTSASNNTANNTTPVVNNSVSQKPVTIITDSMKHDTVHFRYISGVVKDKKNGEPLIGVNVTGKGTTLGTVTDIDGKYELLLPKDVTTLVFMYIGYANLEKPIISLVINALLEEESSRLDELVVTSSRSGRIPTYSIQSINIEEINSIGTSNYFSAIQAKTPGVRINIAAPGASTRIVVSESLAKNENAKIIIDGIVVNDGKQLNPAFANNKNIIDPDDIKDIKVIKDSNTILITTNTKAIKAIDTTTNYILDSDIQLQNFMSKLKAESSENQYALYLKTKKDNPTNFAFYIDVANYFYTTDRKDKAIQILSNIAEIDLENHELMRAMAYVLESWKEIDLALDAYTEILKIKGEEPQSHRDYALALAEKGDYQQAVNLLYDILNKTWEDSEDRFEGIEGVIINEINQIIAASDKHINTSKIQKRFLKKMPVDMRVIIDWNKDETDIDLHVTEPNGEECFYENNETENGGRISNDFTEGYGPEEYQIKKAKKGKYEIMIDYYNDNLQTIKTPCIVKVTTFKNYQSKKPVIETKIMRIEDDNADENTNDGKDDIKVGTLIF